jgi:hypothetical protein
MPPAPKGTPNMTAIPREEHDAKIEALEARIDGRLGRMEALMAGMSDSFRETRADIRDSRRSSTSLIIGSTIAVLLGILGSGIGVWQGVLSSNSALVAAFQAGQSSSPPQIQVIPMPAEAMTQGQARPAEARRPELRVPAPPPK